MEPSRVCNRCITDASVPGTVFDEAGICSYCALQDRLDAAFPNDERGAPLLEAGLERVRAQGRGREFDCIVGVSGGRDSTYTLYHAKRTWGLRPLAVYFNDGFSNPTAGRNMRKATARLGVPLVTVSADWRESKDLKIAFLKSSTPDIGLSTDVGIAGALYAMACKHGLRSLVIGHSFRTEGIIPLEWNYQDGRYMAAVHRQFGAVRLRPWRPEDPGFNFDLQHVAYYAFWKRIQYFYPLYYVQYVRGEADELLTRELDWENTGAHYFDDLYQALMTYVYRVKFGIDRRRVNYSSLIRSGQMTREEGLQKVATRYVIEDDKVIALCLKRLGISREEFEGYMALPKKTFRDYPSSYQLIRAGRLPIRLLSNLGVIPRLSYDKLFECG